MTVAVIIPTYGNQAEWAPLVQRASASIEAQTHYPDVVLWKHADTLQHARNWGAAEVGDVEWLIFLDADDELDPGYIEAMLAAGEGDIRRPATIGIYEDGSVDESPVMIPERNLQDANYIVIGAMLRADLFFDVDGFGNWPSLEDWECWQRMVLAGGHVVAVPDAVYRIHVRPGSRNTDQALHDETYRAIRGQHAAAWMGRGS